MYVEQDFQLVPSRSEPATMEAITYGTECSYVAPTPTPTLTTSRFHARRSIQIDKEKLRQCNPLVQRRRRSIKRRQAGRQAGRQSFAAIDTQGKSSIQPSNKVPSNRRTPSVPHPSPQRPGRHSNGETQSTSAENKLVETFHSYKNRNMMQGQEQVCCL